METLGPWLLTNSPKWQPNIWRRHWNWLISELMSLQYVEQQSRVSMARHGQLDLKNPPFGEANLEPSPQPKRDAVERIEENHKVSKHMIELKQCYQEEWAEILLCRPVLKPTGSAWLRCLLRDTMKILKVDIFFFLSLCTISLCSPNNICCCKFHTSV